MDLDGLERRTNTNFIKFSKVLHLGWSNPRHTYRLGGKRIESSRIKKDLGVIDG